MTMFFEIIMMEASHTVSTSRQRQHFQKSFLCLDGHFRPNFLFPSFLPFVWLKVLQLELEQIQHNFQLSSLPTFEQVPILVIKTTKIIHKFGSLERNNLTSGRRRIN